MIWNWHDCQCKALWVWLKFDLWYLLVFVSGWLKYYKWLLFEFLSIIPYENHFCILWGNLILHLKLRKIKPNLWPPKGENFFKTRSCQHLLIKLIKHSKGSRLKWYLDSNSSISELLGQLWKTWRILCFDSNKLWENLKPKSW